MALPVIMLKISESASDELDRNLWNNRFVTASIRTEGKSAPIKLRYRGGHTRGYPKRSYEVVLAGRTYHYNAEYDDPSLIRNALSFAFFTMLGVSAPRTKHVHLYRNGESLGIYLEIEGVEKSYFGRRGTQAAALFYAVNNRADFSLYEPDSGDLKPSLLVGYEHRFGGSAEKERLVRFIRGLNQREGKASAAFIGARLDVDNYLRWLAGAVLTGNYDGFEQNYAIYRDRSGGKFRIIPWDYEGTWGRNCYGVPVASDLVEVTGYNRLTEALLNDASFRRRYKEILRWALAEPFTEDRLLPKARKMLARLTLTRKSDEERWSRWDYEEFTGEMKVIRNYIRERRAIIAREIRRTSF
jgi:spore coat protein H